VPEVQLIEGRSNADASLEEWILHYVLILL
jgi:hypothetical protein